VKEAEAPTTPPEAETEAATAPPEAETEAATAPVAEMEAPTSNDDGIPGFPVPLPEIVEEIEAVTATGNPVIDCVALEATIPVTDPDPDADPVNDPNPVNVPDPDDDFVGENVLVMVMVLELEAVEVEELARLVVKFCPFT